MDSNPSYIQPGIPTREESAQELATFYESAISYIRTRGSTTTYDRHPTHGGKRYDYSLSAENEHTLLCQCELELSTQELRALQSRVCYELHKALMERDKHLTLPSRIRRGCAYGYFKVLSMVFECAKVRLMRAELQDRYKQLRPQHLDRLDKILDATSELLQDWPQYGSSSVQGDDALH